MTPTTRPKAGKLEPRSSTQIKSEPTANAATTAFNPRELLRSTTPC
jgi:hypothetical protein